MSLATTKTETGLRLRLEGVLIGQRPEDSGAIVAGSNGETEYYRVGDRLPGNAELAEVEPARILIRRGGRYESLAFEEVLGVDGIVRSAPPRGAHPLQRRHPELVGTVGHRGAAAAHVLVHREALDLLR